MVNQGQAACGSGSAERSKFLNKSCGFSLKMTCILAQNDCFLTSGPSGGDGRSCLSPRYLLSLSQSVEAMTFGTTKASQTVGSRMCWIFNCMRLEVVQVWIFIWYIYICTSRCLIYIEIRVLLAGQKNMCVSKPMFGICVLLSKLSSGNLPSEQSCQFMAMTSTCQAKRSFLCQVLRHEWALPDVPCSSTWSPKWYALSDQKIEMQNCTMSRVKFRLVWARQNPHRAVRHDKWTGSSRFKWKDVKHDYPHHMAAVTSRGRPPAWAAILSKSLVTQNPSDSKALV